MIFPGANAHRNQVHCRPWYDGFVATGTGLPDTLQPANNEFCWRSRHIARCNITSLKLAIANFYGGEVAPGANMSVTTSIEYPAGVFTQVKWSGVATGTILDGKLGFSDDTAVSIPSGEAFWVRCWQSCAAGIIYRGVTSAIDSGNGEGWDAGVTTADLTMSGTISSQSSYSGRPLAIIGKTNIPSVLLSGDSRVSGTGDSYNDSSSDIGEFARAVGPSFGYANIGCPSETTGQANAAYTERAKLAPYATHAFVNYGINDVNSGTGSAAILAAQQTFYGLIAGPKIYQTTVYPWTTSTDGWTTTVNQTVHANEAVRDTVNAAIRAIPANLTGVFDNATSVETAQDSGIFQVLAGPTAITADGVHLKAAGTALIKAYLQPLMANIS